MLRPRFGTAIALRLSRPSSGLCRACAGARTSRFACSGMSKAREGSAVTERRPGHWRGMYFRLRSTSGIASAPGTEFSNSSASGRRGNGQKGSSACRSGRAWGGDGHGRHPGCEPDPAAPNVQGKDYTFKRLKPDAGGRQPAAQQVESDLQTPGETTGVAQPPLAIGGPPDPPRPSTSPPAVAGRPCRRDDVQVYVAYPARQRSRRASSVGTGRSSRLGRTRRGTACWVRRSGVGGARRRPGPAVGESDNGDGCGGAAPTRAKRLSGATEIRHRTKHVLAGHPRVPYTGGDWR